MPFRHFAPQELVQSFDCDAAQTWKSGAPSSSNVGPLNNCFEHYAARVAANGYSILPIPPGQKRSTWRRWNRFCHEPALPAQIACWSDKYPDYGIALLGGSKIVAIDIDWLEIRIAKRIERLARQLLGNTPLKRIGRYPKRALVYAVAPGYFIGSQSAHKVDIIGLDRFILAWGIHPGTGKPYRWVGETPATVPVSVLPQVTPAQVENFLTALRALLSPAPAADACHIEPSDLPSDRMTPPVSPTRLIEDGRDGLLTRLVWQAYGHYSSPKDIARAAWDAFTETADLRRPKRDGRCFWSPADALSKAEYVCASGKPRPKLFIATALSAGDDWDASRIRFNLMVDRLCVRGDLTRTDAAVSLAMLRFVSSPNHTCFASCETIAAQVGCRPSTVKKARRQLRLHRLWTATLTKGGRGLLAHYRPCLTLDVTADEELNHE